MEVFEKIKQLWMDVTYNSADPRIRDRLLMGSPVPVILVIFCQFLALKGLQKFMSKRKEGFKLANLSLAVAIYLCVTNLYFFIECARLGWLTGYSWACEPVNRSSSQKALKIVQVCHHFVLFKLTYVLELVAFILRKKDKLVTYYIFFHHMTFPLIVWMGLNYQPGGHVTFTGFVNSFYHVILLAAVIACTIWPSLKGKWFNYTITYGHALQFLTIGVHELQLLFYKDCEVSEHVLMYVGGALIYCSIISLIYFNLRSKNVEKCKLNK